MSQPPELLHKNELASQLALQCSFLCHLSSNHQMKWEPHGQPSPASPVSPFLQSSGYSAGFELPFPSCFILKNRHNLDFSFMQLFVQVLACCYFEQKMQTLPPPPALWRITSVFILNLSSFRPISSPWGLLQLHFEFSLSTFPFWINNVIFVLFNMKQRTFLFAHVILCFPLVTRPAEQQIQ